MVRIAAINDREAGYSYTDDVAIQIHQHRRGDYRHAAEIINNSRCDVVCIQHEYGLFGGDHGVYVIDLIDRLRKPIVTTLHSVPRGPDDKSREILEHIAARSGRVVVMSARAKLLLHEAYGLPADLVRLIPPGAPDVPFGDTEPFKKRFGLEDRPVVLSYGLLGPAKGIETMLDALANVILDHPQLAYVVLGVTHPDILRESGELYRISLERRAVELGLQGNVLFHNQYVSSQDLCAYLQAADLFVTPYPEKDQLTSGTLACALATGKAIISTPYWHAQELLANGRGRLVGFGDIDELAAALGQLLTDAQQRESMRRAAYDFGRRMTWACVGEQYIEAFRDARRALPERRGDSSRSRKIRMQMSLPAVRLDHLFTMTDDTGMFQHALHATPDRHHGYSTDDNARALIVAATAWSLLGDEQAMRKVHIHLSFLHFAHIPETGRFHNFMSYDRRWTDDDGTDDCQGRAIWALGHLLAHAPGESTQRLAQDLFRSAIPALDTLRHPRSWALGILGLHHYLNRFEDDEEALEHHNRLADQLDEAFASADTQDWPWPEPVVTYDNARLPQALILAGLRSGHTERTDRGLRVLRWLCDIQTAPQGHLSIIGNMGWMRRNGTRAQYDQHPVEAAALIGACKTAFRASGDDLWLREMRRCFDWFLGRNDLEQTLIDFKSHGCRDGLTAEGVNQNQGAESTLAWLLSLLTMHETQTGDAPDVG
jgi:glycosyltransferase involved in cell wall biosynthesis